MNPNHQTQDQRVLPLTAAVIFAFSGLVVTATFLPRLTAAQESDSTLLAQSATKYDKDLWDIARGGQLYDNWAIALDKSLPSKNHPAYPTIGKKKGGVTWRCKECHG